MSSNQRPLPYPARVYGYRVTEVDGEIYGQPVVDGVGDNVNLFKSHDEAVQWLSEWALRNAIMNQRLVAEADEEIRDYDRRLAFAAQKAKAKEILADLPVTVVEAPRE